MKKSASNSKPSGPRRKRTLSRGADFHPLSEDDLPFLWAAYRKGAFQGFPEGLAPSDFNAELVSRLKGVGEAHILTAPGTRGKHTPTGLVTTTTDGYKTWPRLVWFPWSSSRNKVECFVKWVNEARKTRKVLFEVEPADKRFMDHMARYGIVTCRGLEPDGFAPGFDSWRYSGNLVKDG